MKFGNSLATIAICAAMLPAESPAAATRGWIAFDSFTYRGTDPAAQIRADDQYLNPILAGFYPDPSICRVGEDFYLVNSTFAYFPGVPIFHSRDLVQWRQIGHVLDRPSQLAMGSQVGISGGIYAPTLSHHNGKFYMVTTLVSAGGNFYVTADRPEGPWSDPIWLKDVHGIDPSFFFDDDGKAYILNNGGPPDEVSLYSGHRAIWMQEMDFAAAKPVGPRKIVINGGVDLSKKPIWIEGPHLMKKDGWYILHAAEGGTGPYHSQVVFRSRDVWGPYVPWDQNPILTQRDLPGQRSDPVTCIGHADIVDTPNGDWWAVFLGCRPDNHGNELTGRETFMLPVTWVDGWPRILPPKTVLPRTPAKPNLPKSGEDVPPMTGTFEAVDEFDRPDRDARWVMIRTPRESWYSLSARKGSLLLNPRNERLTGNGNPSYLGRRLQHAAFSAETVISIDPDSADSHAGIAAFQNSSFHFFFAVRTEAGRATEVFVERVWDRDKKDKVLPTPEIVARAALPDGATRVTLRMAGEGMKFRFSYRLGASEAWEVLLADADASFLSTRVAGGFVGVTVGPHARIP